MNNGYYNTWLLNGSFPKADNFAQINVTQRAYNLSGKTEVHQKINNYKVKSFEDILDKFVDRDGTCRTCGKNHRYRPTFEDTPTSIDTIRLLLQVLGQWEQANELEEVMI